MAQEDSLFSFFANAPPGSATSYPAMEARRKIVQALMANSGRKGYPKTLGEGLTAIGDAIGERGMMNQLAAQEAAAQKQAMAAGAAAIPDEARADATPPPAPAPAAPAPVGYAPGDTTEAPARPATATYGGAGDMSGPGEGEYSFMDAQAKMGLKPNMPGYLQSAITSREPDPEMQAYYGALSAKEAPKGASDVSPTGAAGPYQFTRGTGAQYGIPGAARMDPAASTDAVRALTADNAATFQRINGRAPSFAELALMHQQGGATGARMAAGTGNAPARNLAVNNIPSGASPQAAVAQVNKFYGMPNAPAPVSSRDMIAAQLARRTAPGVPQPNPTLAGPAPFNSAEPPGGSQPMAFAGLPPEVSQGASLPRPAQPPLPAPTQGIQPAPAQVAQATPQRLAPQPRMPVPQDIPLTEDEKRGYRIRAQGLALGDPGIVQQGQGLIDYGNTQRTQQYQANLKDWQDQMLERRQRQTAEEAFARSQGAPAAQSEAAIKGQEADVAKRFGGAAPYQQFVADMSKSYDATQQLANTLPTFRQAKQALAQSYTGSGAELKLDANKMLRQMGVPGDYTPAIATELLQSRMKAIAGGLIKSTVGSQNISDADREFVEKAYSGTIKMEPESLRKLLGIAEDTTIRSINRHNDRLLSVASDPGKDTGLRNQYSVPMQYGDAAVAYLKAHPETANLFDEKFGKGHARAVLMGAPYGQ